MEIYQNDSHYPVRYTDHTGQSHIVEPGQTLRIPELNDFLVVKSFSVTLNNDQILACLEQFIVLVPPTETPNFSALPTKIPIPLFAVLRIDTQNGPYIESIDALSLIWGSDINQGEPAILNNDVRGGQGQNFFNDSNTTKRVIAIRGLAGTNLDSQIADSSVYDNALSLQVYRIAGGPFTGGDPANTLQITGLYYDMPL